MPELTCTARRVGDLESRTEEYEVSFAAEGARPGEISVGYQAARAYEINAALDAAAEQARTVISEAHPDLKGPTEETLAQFAWRTMQSAKYAGGEPVSSSLRLEN